MLETDTQLQVPQEKDIGWYLSAILEDPHEDKNFKSAISKWFEREDYQSQQTKEVIESQRSDIEKLLVMNKRLISAVDDTRQRAGNLLIANERLQARLENAQQYRAAVFLCATLLGFLLANLWITK